MTAPHFFVADVSGDRIVLTGEDAHHAVRALRITPGETITVSDGNGVVVTARVLEAGRTLEAEVTGRDSIAAPRPRLAVYQALAKHPKVDTVVARLAELGVGQITPFAGSRSVARWDAPKAATQHRRLNQIAREAAMQSRRPHLPHVRPLGWLDDIPSGALILHEEASTRLSAVLPSDPPEEVTLVAGPEGGFDPGEVAELTERGGTAVSLGTAVLRTETAAFAAVCVVLVRYGLLG